MLEIIYRIYEVADLEKQLENMHNSLELKIKMLKLKSVNLKLNIYVKMLY